MVLLVNVDFGNRVRRHVLPLPCVFAMLDTQVEIVGPIPRGHPRRHLIFKLLLIGWVRVFTPFAERTLKQFTSLREEFGLPPTIRFIPCGCALVKVDHAAELITGIYLTAMQYFGVMQQNVSGFHLRWNSIWQIEILRPCSIVACPSSMLHKWLPGTTQTQPLSTVEASA